MKIPKKINTGGHVYSVELKKSKDAEKGRNNWGVTFLEDKRIIIDSDIPRSLQEETFLHEVMHVCFNESQMGADISNKVFLDEEQMVSRLASSLYAILKDNKLLSHE